MRPPARVWRCEGRADDLADLRHVIRAYLAQPGARTMHPTRLTPLEKALTPERHLSVAPRPSPAGFLTAREAAAILGWSISAVHQWGQRGHLTRTRERNRHLYREDEIRGLAENDVEPVLPDLLNVPDASMESLTPQVRERLESMAAAAENTGYLRPVLEPCTPGVDLLYLREGRPVAAIRVRLDAVLGWRAEWPARPLNQRVGLYTEGFAQPGETLTNRHFSGLDRWWARIPETGVSWKPSPDPWLSAAVRA